MKRSAMDTVKQICWEIIGSILVAIGICNFAVPAELPMTGFSGISIILYRLWNIPIGLSTALLNIPVAIWSWRLLGRRFFISSIRCMIISSVFIDCLAPLFPLYEGSRLLAALCTGVIAGLGYALIYMQNSSTGGTDFITLGIKAIKPHIALGKIIFVFDMCIVFVGGLIFRDVDGIIYGAIVSFLYSVVVDKVMYGINAGKLALIVTNFGEKICDVIDQSSGRGTTIINAKGGYSGADRQIVMCACSGKEMHQVQKAVKEADPEAFVIVLESNEVHGEGFKMIQIGEKEER